LGFLLFSGILLMTLFLFLLLWIIAASLDIGKEFIQIAFLIFAAFLIVEVLAWLFFFGTMGCAGIALGVL
jgi:hypothetical protein